MPCSALAQEEAGHENRRGEQHAAATKSIAASADAADVNAAAMRNLGRFEKSIRPILMRACFDCHSGDRVEGNFRADQLDPDLANGNDTAWWLEVYSVLSKGEMPPPESNELNDVDRTRIVDWLATEIQAAEKQRENSATHTSFRRLTRYEYNYALQDLLGVPWTFANDLPAEASEEGAFENDADSLHMSVQQIETYHQIALRALRRVTVRGDRPPMVHWAIPMKTAFDREIKKHDRSIESIKEKFEDMPEKRAEQIERSRKNFEASADRSHYLEHATGLRAKIDWSYRKAPYAHEPSEKYTPMPDGESEVASHFAVLQPGRRQDLTIDLGDRLPDQGTLRVRIRASRAEGVEDAQASTPSLQLHFGFQATDQGRSIKRIGGDDVPIDAPFGQPKVYHWNVPLSEIEHRNTYRGKTQLGDQPNPSEYIRFTNSTIDHGDRKTESSAILIDYVEVSAPVYEQWPPRTHRAVFVESDHSHDETIYAREIISAFMSRAWRRFPATRDIDRKVRLFKRLRPSSNDFQEAVIEVLATVLTSPKCLYVLPGEKDAGPDRQKDRLSQNELATRLSLFLWCSLPDETLLKLASADRLNDPEILGQQVNRMLADPRSARFANHFVAQWLKMQPLEFLSPTRGDDGLDSALLESMKREPIALFADMLQHDSSVLDFIDSQYLVINERLAGHYGIPGVQGNHFRRVSLPTETHRGGLLTQAGLLTMNSDGTDSHPVKRGVWLLTNLLNDPPPPPPPAVPEIDLTDPEIAKLTLKERIEDHRNHAACLSCHQKIDPWGIAFENYDALGRWREKIEGENVDAQSHLPGEVKLDGMRGLKKHLVQDKQEQFVQATVEKMASFGLGRQTDFADRAAIRKITERVRNSGDGIKTMVMCLVTSELFQTQ